MFMDNARCVCSGLTQLCFIIVRCVVCLWTRALCVFWAYAIAFFNSKVRCVLMETRALCVFWAHAVVFFNRKVRCVFMDSHFVCVLGSCSCVF